MTDGHKSRLADLSVHELKIACQKLILENGEALARIETLERALDHARIPVHIPKRAYNTMRYSDVVQFLWDWRSEDHADVIVLHRNDICALLDDGPALQSSPQGGTNPDGLVFKGELTDAEIELLRKPGKLHPVPSDPTPAQRVCALPHNERYEIALEIAESFGCVLTPAPAQGETSSPPAILPSRNNAETMPNREAASAGGERIEA